MASSEKSLVENLLRVSRTVAEMMEARGFAPAVEDAGTHAKRLKIPAAFTQADVLDFYKSLVAKIGKNTFPSPAEMAGALATTYTRGDKERWAVFYDVTEDDKQVGIANVRGFLAHLDKALVQGGIFITNTAMTSQAREAFRSLGFRQHQHFTFEQLLINVTKHVLVPKYEHIRDPEKIKAIAHGDKSRLPGMSVDDPIARFYGAKVGELFVEHADVRIVPQMVSVATMIRRVI